MGLFDWFKNKKKEGEMTEKNFSIEQSESSILLSMPMFNGADSYNLQAVIDDLKSYWKLDVSDVNGDAKTATMSIDGVLVALASMPAPIPAKDIEDIAPHNYLWKNAEEDCRNHQSHAIVTVLSSKNVAILERYKMLTKLNASILRTSGAIGIYQGTQTLLLPKDLYLDFANFLLEEELPIQLWVYIGLIGSQDGSSVYTFGLKDFQKREIEVLDSKLEKMDLYDFLLSIVNYVVAQDVVLQDGETIGFSAEQKIAIRVSEGRFLEGNTIKLEL
ncbi:DUF4261 domain-containing protein [Aureispira sp. CCB-E]|nr:DUF4261 domain-containing protein [Aureispira sp. CCB-E]WMX15946.1 DUF4261 domain-containing protein [Aureispira sp. CCB-E]